MSDQQNNQGPASGTSSDAPEESGDDNSTSAFNISATYSPEDNKLRLYPSRRLDEETYARVKAAGFGWAPKQELFVAPSWTPGREDLAIELAGEIEPEQMTVAERAQAKAERLDELGGKRHREANAFHRAANELSRAFEGGQPILVGHHSEAKARRTQTRMHSAMSRSVKAEKLSSYWLYRAEGVERHANMKNNPRVRANRIRTLLAELRDHQRTINHANIRLKIWETLQDDKKIVAAIGGSIPTGRMAHHDLYYKVERGEVTPQDARQMCIEAAQKTIASKTLHRWIEHTLNRLSYEREMLGAVKRYEGALSGTILQAFAREHGAYKPAAKKSIGDAFVLESSVPLPLHLAAASTIELSADGWRDLMQSVGYEVPAKKDAAPPILNLRVKSLESENLYNRGQFITYSVVEMTKAEYAKVHSDQRGTRLSRCRQFRFKICPHPKGGPIHERGWCAVFLTDSKAHPVPATLAETASAEAAA